MLPVALAAPAAAVAHSGVGETFRTRVLSVEPEGLPVDVRITDSDQIRFENAGDEVLELCGYESEGCTPWVRIGPDGVFEDRSSAAYVANAEEDAQRAVPEAARSVPPDFVRVRDEPAAYAYHDHRVHWMGDASAVPPGVDERDPSVQEVFDGEVRFRYGDTDGVVRTRLEYVGGRSWFQRYGEYALVAAGVVAMLAFFAIDARRRRRAAGVAAADEEPVHPRPGSPGDLPG